MWLIFLLYALFGSVFTAAKSGLEHAEPFFLVGFRMLIAGVVILLWLLYRDKSLIKVRKEQYFKILMLAVFNIYITNGFEFWGMQYLTSSKASFIYSLSPFFAAIMSWIFLKEKLSLKKLTGLFIGVIGFIPVLWKQTVPEEGIPEFWFLSMAELAVIFAALATVYGWIVMRQLVSDGMSPVAANGYSMLIGGCFSSIHSLFIEDWNPLPVFGSWTVLAKTTIWMIIVSSFICYNLYGYLLRRYSVTFMSFSGFSTPFFTALFSWLTLGETVELSFCFSAVIVFGGLFLFYQEELRRDGVFKKENHPSL